MTLIKADSISFAYGKKPAVENVSFTIKRGEIMGIVGESGSGKTTTGRMLAGLLKPQFGSVQYLTKPQKIADGFEDLYSLSGQTRRDTRRKIQMIFQNPYASLDPKLRISEIILEGVDNFKLLENLQEQRRDKATQMLELVGLEESAGQYYPHQFSGGQRQRISIARALAVDPEFLIADEAVSALDVSLCAGIINLLMDIRRSQNLTIAFISHDLDLVGYLSDRVMVMRNGEVIEKGNSEEVLSRPQNAYTQDLLSAVPKITS